MKKITLILIAIFIAVLSSLTTLAFEKTLGTPFPDIDYDAYYADSVVNLAAMGVITGYDNGNFGPNDYVTRAQLATILNRFSDKTISGHYGERGNYEDATDPTKATNIYSLQYLVCGGFSNHDFSNPHEAYTQAEDTYTAICLNGLQ